MLDKLKLNNHITSLRTDVQKAKVQVIQKLIRRVRQIETDSSKSKQDPAKKESKVAKLKEEITVLKKLHFREIVRHALLLEKDPKAILSDGKAKTEERCVARIYEHKIMFKKLMALKEMFSLNEKENIKGLRSMGYSKTQKAKLKKREKLRNVSKKTKMEWVVEDIESEGVILKQEENKIDTTENVETNGNEKEETQKAESVQEKPKQKMSTTKKPPKVKKVEFSSESEDDEADQGEKTADSFFLTTSGENYLTTVTKHTSEDDQHYKRTYREDDDYEVETRINQQTERENYENNQDHSSFKNRSFDRPVRHNFRDNGRDSRPFDRKLPNRPFNQEMEEDLHPSWKAKQQQRVIQPFQGKKFKFDEGSDPVPIPAKSSNEMEKDLHPSWAAKLKAKPIITEFAGKKIKFDDD